MATLLSGQCTLFMLIANDEGLEPMDFMNEKYRWIFFISQLIMRDGRQDENTESVIEFARAVPFPYASGRLCSLIHSRIPVISSWEKQWLLEAPSHIDDSRTILDVLGGIPGIPSLSISPLSFRDVRDAMKGIRVAAQRRIWCDELRECITKMDDDRVSIADAARASIDSLAHLLKSLDPDSTSTSMGEQQHVPFERTGDAPRRRPPGGPSHPR